MRAKPPELNCRHTIACFFKYFNDLKVRNTNAKNFRKKNYYMCERAFKPERKEDSHSLNGRKTKQKKRIGLSERPKELQPLKAGDFKNSREREKEREGKASTSKLLFSS